MLTQREIDRGVNAVRDDHSAVAAPGVTDQGAIIVGARRPIQSHRFNAITVRVRKRLIGSRSGYG